MLKFRSDSVDKVGMEVQLVIDVRKRLMASEVLPTIQMNEAPKVSYTQGGLSLTCGARGSALMVDLYDEVTSEIVPDKVLVKFVPNVGQGEHLYTEVIMRSDQYLIAGLMEGMAETVWFEQDREAL